MQPAISFVRRYTLLTGITLMFLLTWPLEAIYTGLIEAEMPAGLLLFLGWGVSLAALFVTGLTQGKSGVISLLKRLAVWRVGVRWYIVAFLLEPLLFLVATYAAAAWTGTPPDFDSIIAYRLFGRGGAVWLMVLPFFLVELVSNGEEMGWRGFVLPRLQAKVGPIAAGLIVGLIWALWHLPKFLPGWNTWSFMLFTAHTLAFSMLLTWIYNSTNGSLLLASLMHATLNTAGVFLPVAVTSSTESRAAYAVFVALEILVVILVALFEHPARDHVVNSDIVRTPTI